MSQYYYLPFHSLFGKALRHVAIYDETWLALLGWQAGAFKVGVRDEWIGWSAEQQFSRLHLIANNARFLVLKEGRLPNLASRALGLSLRRLEADMRQVHGYPVYLAETFVDPSKFAGTCYQAANWQFLGLTRGFSRVPGKSVSWLQNGQPKQVLAYPLRPDAATILSRESAAEDWQAGDMAQIPSTPELHSLDTFLESIDDFRQARGKRYRLACFLAIAIAARLAGYRGVTAFGEFAARMTQEQLKAVGAFWSPRRQCYTAPAASTFHYILAKLESDTLDRTIGKWVRQQSDKETPVAIDGKDIRGASAQLENENRMMVAAVEHSTGLVLGQTQVPDKTNEIPAVRELSRKLDLAGRVVTLDAMHVQQETARSLLEDCAADYVTSSVKNNQPTIHDDLKAIDWSTAACFDQPAEKGHGRIENRRCLALDISGSKWDNYCQLYGRQQAIRIERERYVLKTDKTSHEVVYCLTSLSAEKASPEQLLALVRNHWHLENRLHYVRDFTYDEDRCRVRVGHLPRNLACLSNAAISIVRTENRFEHLPPSTRHYAAHPEEALNAILKPLTN